MLASVFVKAKQQWKLTIFVVFFFPLLCRLGLWQLDRGEEKQQLSIVYQEQSQLPAIDFDSRQQQLTTHYQTVIVKGYYDDNRYWLLDNQPYQGRAGYQLIMPFKTGDQWLLVNRGWVAAGGRRDTLPSIATPRKVVTIRGYLYQPTSNIMIHQTKSDLPIAWPKRVLQLNSRIAQSLLKEPVYPTQLRINHDSAGALIVDWPIINTLPEKHRGYAVQWFSMALALVLLYVWALINTKKQRNGDRKAASNKT